MDYMICCIGNSDGVEEKTNDMTASCILTGRKVYI